jgi:hypothetical protein
MTEVEEVVWAFFGYETLAGGRPVQDWFDALLPEEKDEALDTLGYLQHLPLRLWSEPEYAPLGRGLSEIRFKVNSLNETIRIYGFFWPHLPKERDRKPDVQYRPSYTFLHGKSKKVRNDKVGKEEARRIMGKIERKEARVHAFKFS